MNELVLALAILVVPISVLGGYLLQRTWHQTRCANLAFVHARHKMIQSHQTGHHTQKCGDHTITLDVPSLESLDQNSGGVGLSDLIQEARGLQPWELVSSLPSSSSSAD